MVEKKSISSLLLAFAFVFGAFIACVPVKTSAANLQTDEANASSPVSVAQASLNSAGAAQQTERQTKLITDYASLSSAVASIGANADTVLEVPRAVNVAASVTVTKNIQLKLTGAGVFNVADGALLTIENGAGFEAPADKQIFFGAAITEAAESTGKPAVAGITDGVRFTKSNPAIVYPEWFGARGDGATDDLTAFENALESMQAISPGDTIQFTGAVLQLACGKTYRFSSTLNIRRPVMLRGGAGGNEPRCAVLQFPDRTVGVVVHGQDTYDGVNVESNQRRSGNAELRGFSIFGTNSSYANTVLTAAGRQITLTGGAIRQISETGSNACNTPASPGCTNPAVPAGTTVAIHGYDYPIETSPASGSSTFTIRRPRVSVRAESATTLTKQSFNDFPANSDWSGQTVNINGAEYSIRSNDGQRIYLASPGAFKVGETYTAEISGIKPQSNVSARLNLYHGLDLRAQTKIRDVLVKGFAGNGVNLHSDHRPFSGGFRSPNLNNSYLERVYAVLNSGSGFVFYSDDTNNIESHSLNAENNAGFGIYEAGTEGNNFYSFHQFNNGQGMAFVSTNGPTNLMNCYVEFQPEALFGNEVFVVGGNMSIYSDPKIDPRGTLNFIEATRGTMRVHAPLVFYRPAGVYRGQTWKGVRAELGGVNTNTVFSFGAGEESFNTADGSADTPNVSAFKFGYNSPAFRPGWYNLYSGFNDSSFDQNQTVFAVSGTKAADVGDLPRKFWLPTGFYAGNNVSTERRFWDFVSVAPANSSGQNGDMAFNKMSNPAQPFAWLKTGGAWTPLYLNGNQRGNYQGGNNQSSNVVAVNANASGGVNTSFYNLPIDPPAIAARSTGYVPVPLPGLSTNDVVQCNVPEGADTPGITIAYISARSNHFVITFANVTDSAINPAASNYRCVRFAP